ncbi:cyclic nucleotide-binding domain-containing protein [Paenibacillus hexagrammi]|uniref:Cyclic nucleotide-binding domain-containing protein n=1 Tax=Paenibacillus hexagrammi TaxID=2908839 RepID=A0ABY3SU13_9BACL|nr:cyclic nucleotide-binding domain-containing protein [Paenibacillus sp. YPD9-1]
MYLIKSGVVKIYRLDDAKEIILALFREGDFLAKWLWFRKALPVLLPLRLWSPAPCML